MTTTARACVVAMFAACLGGVCPANGGAPKPPAGSSEWVYAVVSRGAPAIPDEALLNDMGKKGWELVSITRAGQGAEVSLHYVFKRQPSLLSRTVNTLPEDIRSRVAGTVAIARDCMVLAYLPGWAHGDVDNIAIADNDGGVRLLLDWDSIGDELLATESLCYAVALYSRLTTQHLPGDPGKIEAYAIRGPWGENTCWDSLPEADTAPIWDYPFQPGEGWKLFDVTGLVREQAESGTECHGVMLRFADEVCSADAPDWSGYQFVSREGEGEWETYRPLLLVLRPERAGAAPEPAE